MIAQPLLSGLGSVFNLTGRAIAAISVLLAASFGAQAEQYTFSQAEGSVLSGYVGACGGTGFASITVSNQGTTNLNAKSANSALVQLYGYNRCTNSWYYAFGSANNIQFSAQAGNGTQIPASVTASGQVALTVLSYPLPPGTDTLTFQLTLNTPIGAAEKSGTTQTTILAGVQTNTRYVSVYEQFDYNFSYVANATLTLSSQILGTLSTAPFAGWVDDGRSHTVRIIY